MLSSASGFLARALIKALYAVIELRKLLGKLFLNLRVTLVDLVAMFVSFIVEMIEQSLQGQRNS
jgi:hypothetical protein